MITCRKPQALLVFPPIYDFALYDLYIRPYSLLKIGRWLAECGYSVRLLNCLDYRDELSTHLLGRPKRKANGTWKFHRQIVPKPRAYQHVPRTYARYGIARRAIGARLADSQPDVALVSSGMTYWYLGVREIVETLRQTYPRVPVILGGIYASLCAGHAEGLIGPDYLVAGDAYPALRRILGRLNLPIPDSAPEDRQLEIASIVSDAAVLRLNRGCPFRCRYCAGHRLDGAFQPGSWKTVFDTVSSLRTRFGTRNFAFYDDALLADSQNVLIPLLERIIEFDASLRFFVPNALHLGLLNPDVAALMYRAGFTDVRIGFESSSVDFHRRFGRKLSVSDLGAGVECLRRVGFKPWEIGVYVLAGLPRQSRQEVEESLRYVSRFGVRIHVAEYSPVPGTPLWPECVKDAELPLADEPLTHNNSILPLRWNRLSWKDLSELKLLAASLSARKEV